MANTSQLSFYSIIALLSCIYSICVILLSTLPLIQLYSTVDEIELIQQSYQKFPLVDMILLAGDNSKTCMDYKMIELFNFTFPGNKEGCVCPDGEIKSSLCNRTSKGSKPCTSQGDGENVYEQLGLKVKNWGIRVNLNQTYNNESTSKSSDEEGTQLLPFHLCGQYKEEYKFLNSFNSEAEQEDTDKNQEVVNQNSCNYKDREYDLFNLSQFNNITQRDCPITSFQIIDIREIKNEGDQYIQYLDIPSLDYLKLQIVRDPYNYPLSEIQVSWGDGVCSNGQLPSLSDQKYEYKLYNLKGFDCDIDQRYQRINQTQIGQKDLILSNNGQTWVQKLPKFINDNKNLLSIYSRQFPQMSWQCRNSRVKSLLLNDIDVSKLWYYQVFLSIIALCYIIVIQFFRKGENKIKIIIIYKIFLSALHIGIEIWISSILEREMISPIENLCDKKCIDDYTYSQLIEIREKIKQIQFYIQLPFYIYVGILSVEVIYLFIIFMKKKLLQRRKEQCQLQIIGSAGIRNNNDPQNVIQLERDIHFVQQSAHNHIPRQDNGRILSMIAFPPNIINPHSILQIRMDEDQELADKGNSTKDTHSIKRELDFY